MGIKRVQQADSLWYCLCRYNRHTQEAKAVCNTSFQRFCLYPDRQIKNMVLEIMLCIPHTVNSCYQSCSGSRRDRRWIYILFPQSACPHLPPLSPTSFLHTQYGVKNCPFQWFPSSSSMYNSPRKSRSGFLSSASTTIAKHFAGLSTPPRRSIQCAYSFFPVAEPRFRSVYCICNTASHCAYQI